MSGSWLDVGLLRMCLIRGVYTAVDADGHRQWLIIRWGQGRVADLVPAPSRTARALESLLARRMVVLPEDIDIPAPVLPNPRPAAQVQP